MIHSNYHIHSTYCDGHNTLEEMVLAAKEAGLDSIGFTTHFPCDYDDDYTIRPEQMDEYLDEIDRLKEKYPSIDIYKSFEVDYYPHKMSLGRLYPQVKDRLDYLLASIHTMGYLSNGEMSVIDYTEESFKNGILQIYGSPENYVKHYYEFVAKMVLSVKPDILGHIDLIRKNNKTYFDESKPYYKNAYKKALDAVKKSGAIMEINTGGMYRYGDHLLYPSPDILREALKREIPITVNGDTHFSDGIAYKFDEVRRLLLDIGFRDQMVLKNGKWTSEKL